MGPVSIILRQNYEHLIRLNESLNQLTQGAADIAFKAADSERTEDPCDTRLTKLSIEVEFPTYGEAGVIPRQWTVYLMDLEASFNLAGSIPPLARHSGALRALVGKVYALCTLVYMAWSVARFDLKKCMEGDAGELCQLTESMVLGRTHLIQALSHIARGLLEEKMPWITLAGRICYDMLGFRVRCIGEESKAFSFLHVRNLWPLVQENLLRPNGF